MFLRHTKRKKDGKEHRYWSIVENRRIGGGRVVQRPLLYLGEINDSQELAWRKSIAILEEGALQPRTLSLFPEDRCEGLLPDASIVRLRLNELRLCRPRQWGGCWLALSLWRELELDRFWGGRLPPSRKGTRWDRVLLLLATYRLLAPGREWRVARERFERSAMADLLGEDLGLAEIHKLYRCHDRLLEHKQALFDHLVGRWRDLFNISFDVLLYDLTSTYFEADPPFAESDKRRHGYSRDHRPDCVQVVIAPRFREGRLWWWPRRGCRWPTRRCLATPRTTPPCATSWRGSSGSTARRGASGCWSAASRPRRCRPSCG